MTRSDLMHPPGNGVSLAVSITNFQTRFAPTLQYDTAMLCPESTGLVSSHLVMSCLGLFLLRGHHPRY
jgi:hypothetical protein